MHQHLPRYFNLVFFGMVAALMSGAVSFVVTAVNLSAELGFGRVLVLEWLKAWAFAYPIAFPVAMVVSPAARRFTWHLLGQTPPASAPSASTSQSSES